MHISTADVSKLYLEMLPHLLQATQTKAASSHGELFMITGLSKEPGFCYLSEESTESCYGGTVTY